MAFDENITVELVEKELINVDLVEKEIANINFSVIDFLTNRNLALNIHEFLVVDDDPVKVTSKKFRVLNPYISGSLIVFFNGIREKYITENSDTEFSFGIDIIDSDVIQTVYIKK